jgi:hypothetical protein
MGKDEGLPQEEQEKLDRLTSGNPAHAAAPRKGWWKTFPPPDDAELLAISARLQVVTGATEALDLIEEDARLRLRTHLSPGITLPAMDIGNAPELVSAIESIAELALTMARKANMVLRELVTREPSSAVEQDPENTQGRDERLRVAVESGYAATLVSLVWIVAEARLALLEGDAKRATGLALGAALRWHFDFAASPRDGARHRAAARAGALGAQRRSEIAQEKHARWHGEYELLKRERKSWTDEQIHQHIAKAATEASGVEVKPDTVGRAIRKRRREIGAGAPK